MIARSSKVLTILFFISIFISCDSSYLSTISRVVSDPSPDCPTTHAYESLHGIEVEWKPDPLCDSFILYRKKVTDVNWVVIYKGTGINYFDTENDIQPDTLYCYRLSKMRGSKLFENMVFSLGAYNQTYVADPAGSNNFIESAIEYKNVQIDEHSFYLGNNLDQSFFDYDWFFVNLAPFKQLSLAAVFDNSHSNAGELLKVNVVDQLGFMPLSSNLDFTIKNNTDKTKKIYFCIQPNISSSSGNLDLGYYLKFVKLTDVN